jgi:DNA-binding GntR family transcriptional regulator
LREQIERGTFKPGTRLREKHLATAFETSRPSIREALKVLESDGLVEHQANRSFMIPCFTLEDAINVYQAREVLEGLAARLFTERATAIYLEQLEAAIEAFGKVATESETLEDKDRLNILFTAKNAVYAVLLEGAGNPVITELLRSLRGRIWVLRRSTLAQPGRPQQTYQELKAILAAAKAADSIAAEKSSIAHVRFAAKVAYSQLRKGGKAASE